MYCINIIGESTYSVAKETCRLRNAKLPMPRNSEENYELMTVLTGLGLNPDHASLNGTPIILGMVDSARGSIIGEFFLQFYLLLF